MTDQDDNIDQPEAPSKSQLKRDAQALQDLGTELLQLDNASLQRCALPEALLDAVLAARKIKQHGARKRQLQYIGKLMRGIDPAPIEAELNRLRQLHLQSNATFHLIEQWRDRLLQDEQSLAELIEQYPQLDRQHLRQLIRNARSEQAQNKPPRHVRNLFRYLREIIQSEND
ncbi:MAG: DUF615 domain-containing protein [Gammaproteobacteria bacterium]|nr:DUF615 domain-containing protein [Gammaproteobacteria bacterium]MDH5653663.1 DUF615 domain-containing protein [Gammaproteobacteria bacterium]